MAVNVQGLLGKPFGWPVFEDTDEHGILTIGWSIGCRLSHGIFAGPFTGSGFVLWLVSLVDVGDLWHEWIVWVWISEQGADGEQNLRDGESGRPLVLEDIQADASV